MKRILLFILLFLGLTSFVYARGIDSQTNIDQTGFPFTPVTKTDTNADDVSTMTKETDTVVWTPTSGKKIVLMGTKFNSSVATTLLVESGSTAVIPLTECTASGQIVVQSSTPIWEGATNETLTYTNGTVGRHSILLWGYEIK